MCPVPIPDVYQQDIQSAMIHSMLWFRCLWDHKWHTMSYNQIAASARLSSAKVANSMRKLVEVYGLIESFDVSGPVRAYRDSSATGPLPERRTPIKYGYSARKPISSKVRLYVYGRDGYRCVACGTTENLSLDHIYPWSMGGSDEPSNLQTMCRRCNSKKGAKTW